MSMSKATTSSSEIDDIFSRKAAIPKTSQHSSSNYKQKKRKNKLSQIQLAKSKRPPPEIVLDPSIQLSHVSTSKAISHDRPGCPSKKRKLVETRQDQDKFRDSRGTVPRRKTEEGFSIYKEDELGINAEAGDTPLCPFDCNCCF
ncbi:DUF1764-domain-containing protein [Lactifluus subvellereus]|nr:DUF1764-domain-containing protein [Lactifluus subvellereus]